MRRTIFVLMLLAATGCSSAYKSVEVAVDYPLVNVHVVAKFEAGDEHSRSKDSKHDRAL